MRSSNNKSRSVVRGCMHVHRIVVQGNRGEVHCSRARTGFKWYSVVITLIGRNVGGMIDYWLKLQCRS